MTEIPVISGASVLATVDPATAVERTHQAFLCHARDEWATPPKVVFRGIGMRR